MEAVPRMPMIWLDLKEAGEFAFQPAVKKNGNPSPLPPVEPLEDVFKEEKPLAASLVVKGKAS